MTKLRTVSPIKETDGKKLKRNPIAPPPKIAWLALNQLVVDEEYQRALSANGMRLIRRLVETWDWNCFKPLSVAAVGDGRYEIVDGQHTALAAATHGSIETLPCLVLDAATLAQRSAAFVGINRDRLALTPYALFKARVSAEDPEAVAVQAAIDEAGALLFESINSVLDYQPGSLACVSSLLIVVRAIGQAKLTRVLKICIEGSLTPIPSSAIKGVADLVADGSMSDAEIAEALGEIDRDTLVDQVRERVWRGTAHTGASAVVQILLHNAERLKAA